MNDDPEHLVATFSVADRFGTEGIVGAAWLHRSPDRWQVLNLVLSCRVLGRGIELAIASWLARTAREAGAGTLAGTFVPSGHNGVAAEFWTAAGFVAGGDGTVFTLDLHDFADPAPAWVTIEEKMPDA
jgi:FkbH-like protein